ncbi:YjcZ family sporulation protein [Heyndrickxia oleronia]
MGFALIVVLFILLII